MTSAVKSCADLHPTTAQTGSAACNNQGVLRRADADLAALLGMDAAAMIGCRLSDLLPVPLPDYPWPAAGGFQVETPISRPSPDGAVWTESAWIKVTVRWMPTMGVGDISHFVLVEDVTRHKDYEDRLRHQAHYDQLTGLPNRLLAMDRIEQAQAVATRKQCHAVVMLVVVEHLGRITHALGCDTADQVLLEFADRLCGTVRDADTVAHLEGGEFLVILGELDQPETAEYVARRVVEAGRQAFSIKDHEILLSVRIGMATFPHDGHNAASLIRKAHGASARAKDCGGNSFRFFTPRMDEESQSRFRMESLLLRAAERNELDVHFQPLIGGQCGRIRGAEALIRWHSPELGTVPPDLFIPIAEANGHILPLSDWVLERACGEALDWVRRMPDFRLALNFSPRQFEQPELVDHLRDLLDRVGLAPNCVEVEVTERLILGDVTATKQLLTRLKDIGVSLSLDDFGTGYSALSYLKRYPFDTLKVDRAFITDLEQSADDQQLVSAIVDMAHALHMTVIAEGVETAGQEAFLRHLGCEYMQGYFFSRPVPKAEFSHLLITCMSNKGG